LNRRIGVQEEHRLHSQASSSRRRRGRDAAVELDANVVSLLISYSPVCISGFKTGSSF
jgi:hypothetical protein